MKRTNPAKMLPSLDRLLREIHETEGIEESEFTYAIAQAAVDGKKEVEIDGKKVPVKMSKEKAKQIVGEMDAALAEDDKKPGSPGYYVGKKTLGTKSNKEMAREIEKCKKEPRPKSCYDEWSADKTYKKKQRESRLYAELDAILSEVLLLEKISEKTRKTLKNKAEDANMPLGALTAVYRKGLAAWLTGHRQGVAQHQWAMGRVNSFISGGKARQVDSAEWEKVQKHRKKK